MRRNELRDLELVVEERSHALLRLAHDAENQGVRVLWLGVRVGGVLLEHDALADHYFFELVGPPSPWIFPINVARAMRVVEILTRENQPVENEFEQRRGRLLGNDLHGVLVERDGFLDWADVDRKGVVQGKGLRRGCV